MAISLDELFSDKYSTAVVATAVAAAAEAAAAEETPEAVSPPEAQKEVKEAAKEEVKEEPKEEVIELKVPICCEGCVEKMEKKLILMEGVVGVECDVEKQKVTVRGTAKPEAVLKKSSKNSKAVRPLEGLINIRFCFIDGRVCIKLLDESTGPSSRD